MSLALRSQEHERNLHQRSAIEGFDNDDNDDAEDDEDYEND